MHGLLSHLEKHRKALAHTVPVREMSAFEEGRPDGDGTRGAGKAITKLRSAEAVLRLDEMWPRRGDGHGEGRVDLLLDSPLVPWTMNQADIVAPRRGQQEPLSSPPAVSCAAGISLHMPGSQKGGAWQNGQIWSAVIVTCCLKSLLNICNCDCRKWLFQNFCHMADLPHDNPLQPICVLCSLSCNPLIVTFMVIRIGVAADFIVNSECSKPLKRASALFRTDYLFAFRLRSAFDISSGSHFSRMLIAYHGTQ
jgi:hypothetical protein